RLRATGDLVGVAAPTGVDPVQPLRGDPDPAFRVHGYYAVATTDHGSTVIRWTERGVTYEVSSRTLDAGSLADLANKLRERRARCRPRPGRGLESTRGERCA